MIGYHLLFTIMCLF